VFCANYLEKFVKSNFDTSILNDSWLHLNNFWWPNE
jgi:hypothetical protein